jgi:hypothetical protein
MKLFFTLIVSVFISVAAYSQTCDIQTPGIEAFPTSINVGQTSDLRFSVFNNANFGTCQYAANSVLVVISLPGNGLAFQSIVSPAGGAGSFFTWTYSMASNVVIGTNHTALADGQGEVDVTVRVLGTALPGYPTGRQVNINIFQNPSGPIFPSNNPGNDNGFTTITINAPLPIELSAFDVSNKDCGTVDIAWQTASEKNNDYMEIQRSTDGRSFAAVGKVNGTNKPDGDKYSFTDKGNLVEGQTYFYRLKQVDLDGASEIFKIVSVKNDCPGSDLNLSLYPNPAFDKVNVSLSGFEEQETVKLIITNAIGEVVMTVSAASTAVSNEIKIQTLPAGVYSVRIEGNDRVSSKRFIKIH